MQKFASVMLGLALILWAVAPARSASSDPGQVVDRFFEAYRNGSVEEMVGFYAADAVFEDVNQRHRVEGAEQLREFLAGVVQLHSKIGLDEKRRVTMGNTVVVEYAYTGTVSGAVLRQITGKETCQDTDFVLPVTSWYEIEGGRIVRQKDFIDLTTLREIQERASGKSPAGSHGR